ncbi:MAG: enoyl-CoA hydratase-related protein [Deltaproteobacteria bacterium]|nr:enoyl-CoA hydratase-related protein [Deltaproteobacteria bacterium]
MPYTTILVEKRPEDKVGIITLNRPEVRNAINAVMREELVKSLALFAEDPEVCAVILTGGSKNFTAGADITAMVDKTALEQFYRTTLLDITFRMEKMSKPIIAAIAGFALGGGCELALACDIRIAGRSAKLGQTEINVGIIPGAGGTVRLTRLVGMGKAKELVMTGKIISADEACAINLVNAVVDDEKLMEEALNMARLMTRHSPVALGLAKYSIQNAAETDLHTATAIENACFSVAFSSEDQKEGMRAFLEKRKPVYKGK